MRNVLIAVSCFCVTVIANEAMSMDIDDGGAHHDGAFLEVSAVSFKDKNTVVLNFSLECRKNWTGYHRGVASLSLIDITSSTNDIKDFKLKCKAKGPGDGGTDRDIDSKKITISGKSLAYIKDNYCIAYQFDSESGDWTKQMGDDLKVAFNDLMKKVNAKPFSTKDKFTGQVNGLKLKGLCLDKI